MVSSLYASALAVLFLILTIRVIKIRHSCKIALGDAGNLVLQKAIRAQSNFCETAPLAMILLVLAEANGANNLALHFCASILVLGRISHAFGISAKREDFRFRASGMVLTFTSIITLTAVNLILYFLSF
jgi:uncharacterized membrane protein YecN with MAPEG domain